MHIEKLNFNVQLSFSYVNLDSWISHVKYCERISNIEKFNLTF